MHRTLFSSLLSCASVLAIGLSAGRAHAQAAPPAPPPPPATTEPAPPPPAPPPPNVVESNPLAEQQLEQIRKMVSAMPKIFEFHGYLRSGFGVNVKGGDQEAFQAPGAYSKYRLGNETETYGEIGLTANWINPDHNDTWFATSLKLAIVAPRNSTFDVLNAIAIREGFAEAGHVFAAHPEMTFWAGQRFYRRRDVHITDFFFNDMSGYGAGFQDLKVGEKMKLHVAYLGGSVENPKDMMGNEVSASLGRLAKNMFDIRLGDIPAGPGNLELLLIPAFAAQGNSAVRNLGGFTAGVFYFTPMLGGFNEASAQFGYRGMANLSTFVDNSIANDGWLLRAIDRLVIQATPQLSMMGTFQLQFDNKNGTPTGTTDASVGNTWVSVGARPVYNFTKYTAIAVEGGVDVVKPEADGSSVGVLGKLTVAPLIRPGMDFWARPEIRAYLTLAAWNETLKGKVGGVPFADETFGLTAGVQMESWW